VLTILSLRFLQCWELRHILYVSLFWSCTFLLHIIEHIMTVEHNCLTLDDYVETIRAFQVSQTIGVKKFYMLEINRLKECAVNCVLIKQGWTSGWFSIPNKRTIKQRKCILRTFFYSIPLILQYNSLTRKLQR